MKALLGWEVRVIKLPERLTPHSLARSCHWLASAGLRALWFRHAPWCQISSDCPMAAICRPPGCAIVMSTWWKSARARCTWWATVAFWWPLRTGAHMVVKRIYIAGPMSGQLPRLSCCCAVLRAQGHHVENPAETPSRPAAPGRATCVCRCARSRPATASTCQPSWRGSRGARIEHGLALDLGLEVRDFGEGSRC